MEAPNYNDEPSVIFTIGTSGSGKTTWAEKYCAKNGFMNVNRDDIRHEQFGAGYEFNYKSEMLVTERQQSIVDTLVRGRLDIVMSDTNLNNKHYMYWHKYFEDLGYNIFIKVFDVDVDECIRRDLARDRTVGEDIIRKQRAVFDGINMGGRV